MELEGFRKYLYLEEKAENTQTKYLRDLNEFSDYLKNSEELSKEMVIRYKNHLIESGLRVSTVNSKIASLNKYFTYLGKPDYKAKSLKVQKKSFVPVEKDLSMAEYRRICRAASGNERLLLLVETLCSTGIRVSELRYFTVKAVRRGEIEIRNKGKLRLILIPAELKNKLLRYAGKMQIGNGIIFRTRSGKPLDRSNIWTMLRSLSEKARVKKEKLFPHNLRKLFAKCFYRMEKDLSKLADVLGHRSIETTRIYIMETAEQHRRMINAMRLVI